MPRKKQQENELKEKIEDIKSDLEIKTKELKKDLKKKTKSITKDLTEKTEEILKDIKDSSSKFDKKDIEENKAMACLAYVLAPIPYFLDKKSKWVRYHSIQGMNLLIIFLILSILLSLINTLLLGPFAFLKTVIRTTLNVFGAIYAITGIINVCNGEAKELPVINKFKLIRK